MTPRARLTFIQFRVPAGSGRLSNAHRIRTGHALFEALFEFFLGGIGRGLSSTGRIAQADRGLRLDAVQERSHVRIAGRGGDSARQEAQTMTASTTWAR
jgi:hypothetical protein